MLSLRLKSPGPFWLEDLFYLAADELRRLPERAARVAAVWQRATDRARDLRTASAAVLRPETLIARTLRRQPPSSRWVAIMPRTPSNQVWRYHPQSTRDNR